MAGPIFTPRRRAIVLVICGLGLLLSGAVDLETGHQSPLLGYWPVVAEFVVGFVGLFVGIAAFRQAS